MSSHARATMRAGMALAVAVTALAHVAAAAAAPSLPAIHHVFVIVLENESASTTFAPATPAPYLAQTLRSQGAFLPNYYGIGHESNDNYLAMISGQAPNPQTQSDCQIFSDFQPGTIGSYGQAIGSGCVFPAPVETVGGQLDAAGLSWRDYNEDMGANPSRESAGCGHPALNTADGTQSATASDEYATRHDPFVYFHSIIDNPVLCDTHVVNLNLLSQDLASAQSTPNFVFITPNLCDDGHDSPCADGRAGGLAQADTFLRQWVPKITGSPAFKDDHGLLMITFDEAATSDTSSCCGEIPGPNSPEPGVSGPGGGRVGAVLLSPCIVAGTVSQQPYNHYSMLRSVEDLFGLPHLGYAGLPGEQSFGSDVLTGSCQSGPAVSLRAPALASTASARPRVRLRWSASGLAAGVRSRFAVQVRAGAGRWRTLLGSTLKRFTQVKVKPGTDYTFRVRATTSGGTTSAWATASTAVPSGVRIRGGRYRGPWRVRRVRGAWEGHVIGCGSSRCTFTLAYRASTLSIIGERGPSGGTVRIIVDGRSHIVQLRARRRRTRQVIYRITTGGGAHKLRISVVRGSVALEGFATAG